MRDRSLTYLNNGNPYTAADFGLTSMSGIGYGSYEGVMDDADTGVVLTGGGTDTAAHTHAALINPQTGAVRCHITDGSHFGSVIYNTAVSHDGKWFTLDWNGPVGVYRTSDCSWVRTLNTGGGHYDLCVSTAGDQVAVEEGTRMYMRRLSDGAETVIYGPDTYNQHVSCRNTKRPGWVYASQSNGRCSAGDPAYAGTKIHNKVITRRGGERMETTAVPSPTGTRVWWKTNWNGTSSGVHSFVAQRP